MICIVGIGNSLRSDDGVGPYVVSQIEARNLRNIETRIVQQQNLELLEEFINYEKVILVDACVSDSVADPEINYYPIVETHNKMISSSHHLDAQLLLALARKLYGKQPNIHVCSIRAESFELGEGLSEKVKERAERAVGVICESVETN